MPRLRDLEPKLAGGYLRFLCPLGRACPLNAGGGWHSVRVAVAPHPGVHESVWTMRGEFPDSLTLSPSINEYTEKLDAAGNPLRPVQVDVQGWHGHVTNGVAQ
jgi:hypothetical protein